MTYNYGTAGGIDDAASRVSQLVDSDGSSTVLAEYEYLGLGTILEVNHPQPDLAYTLIDLSGTVDPDTGGIYSGLDRFGRIKHCSRVGCVVVDERCVCIACSTVIGIRCLSRLGTHHDIARPRTLRHFSSHVRRSWATAWLGCEDGLSDPPPLCIAETRKCDTFLP